MVREFLEQKTLLITGVTGFLGQPLIEKILWSQPQVRRIYVLIRPKYLLGGRIQTAEQRLKKEVFTSTAFDRLRHRWSSAFTQFLQAKVVPVSGDLSQVDLGLSAQDVERLRDEVDIIINSAAVVSFDAPIDQALAMNVRGAERVATFAASCKRARLLHISTAYVCGSAKGNIPEELHQDARGCQEVSDNFPLRAFTDIDQEIHAVERLSQTVHEEAGSREVQRELLREYLTSRAAGRRRGTRRSELERLRRRWISARLTEEGMSWSRKRGWNDTYTYTKALGELAVVRAAATVPLGIVRPAVIESSLNEPSPGWLDGLRMADPLIVAIGKGRLRSLPLNPALALDLVPADTVVNATLALLPYLECQGNPKIIQVATSSQNPITLGSLYELIFQYFQANPMLDRDGRPIEIRKLRFPSSPTFRLQHRIRTLPLGTAEKTLDRLNILPGVDKARRKISSRRIASEKLYYYGELYEPYLNLDCQFSVDHLLELMDSLPPEDQADFDFDVRRINWRHYIQNVHIPGLKKYILKLEGSGSFELPKQLESDFPNTIPELVVRAAERYGDRTALQWKNNGTWERFSYRQVLENAQTVANRLSSFGLKKGDHVLLFAENSPQWGMCHLGAVLAGLVVVPIDWQTWHREVWSVAAFTDARAILASTKALARLTTEELSANESSKTPRLLLSVNRFAEPFALPNLPRSTSPPIVLEVATSPSVDPDDPVAIVFTTGTMVNPKGAVHTHRTFLSNVRGVNYYLSVSEADRLVSVLPLYHCLEFTCGFLMALYGGAQVTYSHSLKPRVIIDLMKETRATCLLGVPTLFSLIREDIERRILKSASSFLRSNLLETSQRVNFSLDQRFGASLAKRLFGNVHQEFGGNVRVLVSGGSSLGSSLYRYFKALGMPIYEGYGLTETAPVLTVNPLDQSREASAGKPLPGVELRLYRPDRDGVGEIIVRTPSLMLGYYRNDEATRAVIRDGWFHTGDLGWVDMDGFVYVTGRCKDVIVTGAGKNVYPTDLEAIYSTLPAVGEICVVGVRSGLTEDVHAVVVPETSLQSMPIDHARKEVQRQIQELARELPSYHRFQQVHVQFEALPREGDGSLDRKAVWEAVVAGQLKQGKVVAAGKTVSGVREKILLELARLSGLGVEEIDETKNLYTDLGLDSLMAVELLLFVERELGLVIPDERVPEFQTVGDIVDELRRLESAALTPGEKGTDQIVRSALPYENRPALQRGLMNLSFRLLTTVFRRVFHLDIHYPERLPRTGPFILAGNHTSHLDSGAVIATLVETLGFAAARRLHVVGARDYFFDSRLKGWAFSTLLNVVPIERDEVGLQGLRLVGSILRRGEAVLIFPEGTRSRSGELQTFRPGVGLLAWEYDVPVVPLYLSGTFEALPAGRLLPQRGKVSVWVGEPLRGRELFPSYHDVPADELYRRFTAEIQRNVEALAREAAASFDRRDSSEEALTSAGTSRD